MLITNPAAEDCRLSWLDLLKGIGVILVVIGHVYVNPAICKWIYSFHMPLFFFQQVFFIAN